jgi:hypothetical protein
MLGSIAPNRLSHARMLLVGKVVSIRQALASASTQTALRQSLRHFGVQQGVIKVNKSIFNIISVVRLARPALVQRPPHRGRRVHGCRAAFLDDHKYPPLPSSALLILGPFPTALLPIPGSELGLIHA